MRGAKAQVVNLSDAEKQGLEKLIKRHQVGQQIAKRARIVLAAARGQKNKEIAQEYKTTLDTVGLWRNRWVKLQSISYDDLSLEDRLQDGPRPGAPARITADQRCQIEALACEKPEKSGKTNYKVDSARNCRRSDETKDCYKHLSSTCGQAFKKMLIYSHI